MDDVEDLIQAAIDSADRGHDLNSMQGRCIYCDQRCDQDSCYHVYCADEAGFAVEFSQVE